MFQSLSLNHSLTFCPYLNLIHLSSLGCKNPKAVLPRNLLLVSPCFHGWGPSPSPTFSPQDRCAIQPPSSLIKAIGSKLLLLIFQFIIHNHILMLDTWLKNELWIKYLMNTMVLPKILNCQKVHYLLASDTPFTV